MANLTKLVCHHDISTHRTRFNSLESLDLRCEVSVGRRRKHWATLTSDRTSIVLPIPSLPTKQGAMVMITLSTTDGLAYKNEEITL